MAVRDARSEFARLFRRGASLQEAAIFFGLSAEEMGLALNRACLAKQMDQAIARAEPYVAPAPTKVWCGQCELLVSGHDAERCGSDFCKARPAAVAA
jgi:lambda repressor-like predicted transcriptional regulator